MNGERDPEDVLREMEKHLEQVRNGTIERVDAESVETDPITEHHRKVIERGANSNSTDEG